MRYVDLAVAALIGTSAITGIVAWDPRSGDTGSDRIAAQTQLRDGLLALLQQRGIAWFLVSPSWAVCSYLSSISNSSFGVSATLGSVSCGSPPRRGSVVASLSMRLVPFEVTLVAWSAG